MAEIVPFPRALDRSFVLKQVEYASRLSPGKAREHLDRQVEVQRKTMLRRGIDRVLVEVETERLQAALSATAAKFGIRQGGVA